MCRLASDIEWFKDGYISPATGGSRAVKSEPG